MTLPISHATSTVVITRIIPIIIKMMPRVMRFSNRFQLAHIQEPEEPEEPEEPSKQAICMCMMAV
jgi:hypothetical protein